MSRPQDHPLPPQDIQAYTARRPIQRVAVAASVVFLLVGGLGFVPGSTTGYGAMAVAGPDSGALLFGVFAVSVLHNLVHLAFGAFGLVLAGTATGARAFLVGGGVVFLLLGCYGLLVARDSAANVLPLNAADDGLHLGLGAVLIALGVLLGRRLEYTPTAG
ncbi:DUF4383 domain-containing protein [Amycolatopsis cihanbeyliensis]|uniref:Uncharacterized protein DUF4383 n=1 Tax=Amycolatopsis cihanbeyliensis TaxID=1128664 RepID=A0A542DNF2_AMYCI|nr:DUF4383 domain-containing protein [Amycolatopsis cihanbeyliensis]TQJ04610.1 uncharacterized protein DUF4383 [Amycolatopsis cihanbeyliensis]